MCGSNVSLSTPPSKTSRYNDTQARISAKKGGGKEPAGAKPAPAPTSAAPPAEKPGVVETQPLFDAPSTRPAAAGRSSPFATAVEGGGLFSNSPSFLDGGDGGDRARAGAEEDEAAAWLEREKAQREQREKARREEEERWVGLVKQAPVESCGCWGLLCDVLSLSSWWRVGARQMRLLEGVVIVPMFRCSVVQIVLEGAGPSVGTLCIWNGERERRNMPP